MQDYKSEHMAAGIAMLAIGIFFAHLFGFTGIRTILGILLASVPFFIMYRKFHIEYSERVVFSFFSGIVLFPSLVYWLGFLIPFRTSISVVFVVLIAVAFAVNKFANKNRL